MFFSLLCYLLYATAAMAHIHKGNRQALKYVRQPRWTVRFCMTRASILTAPLSMARSGVSRSWCTYTDLWTDGAFFFFSFPSRKCGSKLCAAAQIGSRKPRVPAPRRVGWKPSPTDLEVDPCYFIRQLCWNFPICTKSYEVVGGILLLSVKIYTYEDVSRRG